MKEIQLTQGQVALVDDEDFEYLSKFKWHAHKRNDTYYVRRTTTITNNEGVKISKHIWMHRVLMNPPDTLQIDHINHNGLDNRKINLQIVSHRVNNMNRVKGSKTGYCCVYKKCKKFRAMTRINGEKVYLGTFNTPEEAYKKYTDTLLLLPQ